MPIGSPKDFFWKKISTLNDSREKVNDIGTKFKWIPKKNHSHITGKILLYTTTRRKIPNIFGNWHMTFNSPLLNNEELINSPRVGNWNCLYCGELKSCYINSPRVEDWNSKILCAIWECQSFTKEKRGLGKILFFTTCGFATTWWKIQSLFLLGEGLGHSFDSFQFLHW